jgi:hypothetical protein
MKKVRIREENYVTPLQQIQHRALHLCHQVGQNKELDANTRQQGMEVVSQLGRAKPKQLTKAKLVR